MVGDKVRIGILGASGYTGAELLRLLGDHPRAEIRALTAERQAGKPVAEVWPHLGPLRPARPGQDRRPGRRRPRRRVLLPAARDHPGHHPRPAARAEGRRPLGRLPPARPRRYEATYGHPHAALAQQKDAVYGLTEHYRDAIMRTWLVANPGCHTTTAQLPLVPLVRRGLVQLEGIIIDSKTGVSGAGRDAKQASLFTEVAEGINAYGVATHRHTPEIEQCLEDFAGAPVRVTFTPHLIPMSRGILATIYVRLSPGAEPADLHAALARPTRASLSPTSCRSEPCRRPARPRHEPVPDRCPPEPHPRRGDRRLGDRQPREGRLGPGDPEHERDAGLRRADGPAPAAALPVTVTLADVQAAAQRLRGQIERTPCLPSRTLSEITGAEVWLKFENLQYTGLVQGPRRLQQARPAARGR
jgi:N-acetyl-gamma-glutamyl-phosphate reductase